MRDAPAAETALRERLQARFDELPPQQRLVARYLIDQMTEIPFLGVPEVARRSGASEATVVRLAQRLGYDGFAELKADLLEAVRDRVVPAPSAIEVADAEADLLSAVARQETANIRALEGRIDRGAFAAAVQVLAESPHVAAWGLGLSRHFADLLAYLLTQIGHRAMRLSTGMSSPLELLVPLDVDDALVVFSFPPYSRATLQLASAARERGLSTVAICDRASAPIAGRVDTALPVPSDNMMFTNSFAAVSVMLNALVTAAAHVDRHRSLRALSRIGQLLDDDDGVVS